MIHENLEEIYAKKIQKQNQEKMNDIEEEKREKEKLKKQEFSKSWIGRRKAQAANAKAKKIFLKQSEIL